MDPSLYIYFFFSCHEQCCLFKFPNLAVILRHSRCFINFIPYLIADPSHPFVLVLMSLVFKGKSFHTLNIFSLSNTNTSSLSLSPPYSPSLALSSIYSDQPLRHDASERPKLHVPWIVSALLLLIFGTISIPISLWLHIAAVGPCVACSLPVKHGRFLGSIGLLPDLSFAKALHSPCLFTSSLDRAPP